MDICYFHNFNKIGPKLGKEQENILCEDNQDVTSLHSNYMLQRYEEVF